MRTKMTTAYDYYIEGNESPLLYGTCKKWKGVKDIKNVKKTKREWARAAIRTRDLSHIST